MRYVISLLGWFVTYFAAFLMLALPIANCTQASDDPWVGTLILVDPIFLFGLLLIFLARPWSRLDRFVMMPHLLTIVGITLVLAPFFVGSTLQGKHVCEVQTGYMTGLQAAWWHPFWAPIQLACVGLLEATMVLVWVKTRRRAVPLAA